jgi:hypothetical protein
MACCEQESGFSHATLAPTGSHIAAQHNEGREVQNAFACGRPATVAALASHFVAEVVHLRENQGKDIPE